MVEILESVLMPLGLAVLLWSMVRTHGERPPCPVPARGRRHRG